MRAFLEIFKFYSAFQDMLECGLKHLDWICNVWLKSVKGKYVWTVVVFVCALLWIYETPGLLVDRC